MNHEQWIEAHLIDLEFMTTSDKQLFKQLEEDYIMYNAMENFSDEYGNRFEYNLKLGGFRHLASAIKYAIKRAGPGSIPFVKKGINVIWVKGALK